MNLSPTVLAAGIGPLGLTEILILLFVVMLLFGAKRLPDLARGMGKSIREFKKATTDDSDEPAEPEAATPRSNGATSAPKSDALNKN